MNTNTDAVPSLSDAADALEAEYMAVFSGQKKAAKIALEPIVRAVKLLRALSTPQQDGAIADCGVQAVAVVDENDEGLFVEILQGENGSSLKRGDNLFAAPAADSQDERAALSKDAIREVFMKHGFTVKEGQTDLKQYVYDAAYALLARAASSATDNAAVGGVKGETEK